MENPSVHSLTKDIIKMGLEKDCVDAYHATLMASYALEMVMKDTIDELNKTIFNGPENKGETNNDTLPK